MTYTDHLFDLLTIIERSSQISRLLISKLPRWVYLYLLFATLFHKIIITLSRYLIQIIDMMLDLLRPDIITFTIISCINMGVVQKGLCREKLWYTTILNREKSDKQMVNDFNDLTKLVKHHDSLVFTLW